MAVGLGSATGGRGLLAAAIGGLARIAGSESWPSGRGGIAGAALLGRGLGVAEAEDEDEDKDED